MSKIEVPPAIGMAATPPLARSRPPGQTVEMGDIPSDPEGAEGENAQNSDEFDDGLIPADPDEAPAVELWSAVGDVRPWGTLLLLLSWATVFALLAARHGIEDNESLVAWGANATDRAGLDAAWRLLASTFLHAGPAHVFFNATSMMIFGPAVERMFTRWRFWIVYAAGGAVASLASLVWRTSHFAGATSISVGGSGAIYALGGALLVGAFRLRRRLAVGRARALGAALLYLLAGGFAAGFTRNGTDYVAHIGGLIAGGALGALLGMSPRLGGSPAGAVTRFAALVAAAALAISLALALRNGLEAR
jgi:rhomboid protease GluP